MKRVGPKGTGAFVRITWDEAVDTITRRFREVAASAEGPQAILPYSYAGTMGQLQGSSLDRRFFHRLGASLLDRTILRQPAPPAATSLSAPAPPSTRRPSSAPVTSSTGDRTPASPTRTCGH